MPKFWVNPSFLPVGLRYLAETAHHVKGPNQSLDKSIISDTFLFWQKR
jgi:hypothetical protein